MPIPKREGCAVIDDGYTRAAYLAGIPFTTPEVRFHYRPPLITPLSIIRKEIGKSPAASVVAILAKAICKYVTDWDVKDARGDAVPLKPENLANVDPYVFDSVSQIVLGLRFTDIDPEWTKGESETESARELDAVFNGDISEAESADAKN